MNLSINNPPYSPIARAISLLSFLALSILCSDFRLEKSFKLTSITNMVKITALQNDILAVKSSDSTTSTVTILQGATFEKKVSELVSNVDESQIEVTEKGVVINDGKSLSETPFNGESKVFDGFNSSGNMIVTPKYALVVPTNTSNPSVIKIDLSTLKSELVIYRPVEDWKTRTPSYMHYMQNGNILFGMGFNLFIVDGDTLLTKQIVPKGNPENHQVLFISSYVDKEKDEEIILFQRDRVPDEMSKYTALEFDKQTAKYTQKDVFYTEAFSPHIYPTGLNQAVSISYDYQVYYWQSFHSVLSIDYNPNDTITSRDPVAASYGQQLIVMKDQEGNYEFYDVSAEFDVQRVNSVEIGKGNFKKGMFSSDDKWVFVSTEDIDNNEWKVFKIDVDKYTVQSLKDSDGNQKNQLDFHLFDAGSNRFVSLIQKDATNYEIHLRNLENSQIIDKFQLGPDFFDTQVKDIKLVSSLDWGLRFSIATQYKTSAQGSNDSSIYQFDIKQDKIIKLDLLTFGNYSTISACSKYLINYLAQKQKVTLQNFDDFSLAKSIDVNEFTLVIKIEKNTLVLTSRLYNYRIVYNLDKSLESTGMFYLQHYTIYPFFILPTRQIWFEFSRNYRQGFPTRVFYSMQPPNLKQISIIQDSDKPYHSARYFPSNQNDGAQCNQIYYIQYDHQEVDQTTPQRNWVWYFDPSFVRYRQCDKQFLKINLQAKTKVSFTKIFISSDKKYLIVGLKNDAPTDFFIDIRLVSDPTKVVASQKFAITKDTDYYDILDMDFVSDNKLIIHQEQKITVIETQHQSSATSFGVKSISTFDVNKDGAIAVAGPSLDDQAKIKLIIKNGDATIYETTIPEVVKSIVLSPSSKNFAIIDENQEVGVWSTSGIVIYNQKKPGVKKIKFIQDAKLLIQNESTYEIVALNIPQQNKNQSSALPSNYDVQVSKDGRFLAIVSERVVSIFENGGFLANYTVPVSNQKVVSISFSPTNNLIIATSSNNVYVLTTSACPETYHIDNFQCVCQASLYPIDGMCQECSFICSACEGSTSSCTSYSASFIILIAASILIFLGLVVGGIIFYRRKKMRSEIDGSSLMNDEERVDVKSLKTVWAQRND